VDADGNLWVLDYARPGDDGRHWTVFSADGRALGRVETPPGLRVLEIGRDYVLGVWQDELDVEYVRMHRLERAGS
jgi:sugar lactone lactonase YvrE